MRMNACIKRIHRALAGLAAHEQTHGRETDTMPTVSLYRGGRHYEVERDRRLTVENVAYMFQLVNPDSIWLKERYGAGAFFPDTDGQFDLRGIEEYSHLEVEADDESPAVPEMQTRSSTTVLAATTPARRSGPTVYPGFSSVVPQASGKRASNSTFSLKVVQAIMEGVSANGRPTFSKQGQCFVELVESIANVPYVTSVIRNEYGNDHIVVTSDGLEVKDSSGTRG